MPAASASREPGKPAAEIPQEIPAAEDGRRAHGSVNESDPRLLRTLAADMDRKIFVRKMGLLSQHFPVRIFLSRSAAHANVGSSNPLRYSRRTIVFVASALFGKDSVALSQRSS